MGPVEQVQDFEALLDDSDALLLETRRLLDEARGFLRTDAVAADDGLPALDALASTARRQGQMPLRLVGTVVATVGVVLFGAAVFELSQGPGQPALQIGSATPEQARAPVTSTPDAQVDVAPPSPPPLWVSIPRLGARAPVDAEVQVIADGPERGLLSAPPNYHDLGWFRQAGGGGPLVLDGHVGYRDNPGPLAFIGSLRTGDQVTIGNQSSQMTYRVGVVATAVKGQLPAEYFTPAYSQDVMLITCDYTSPFSNGHFADNVYLIANPER